jgi:hypothetical protein
MANSVTSAINFSPRDTEELAKLDGEILTYVCYCFFMLSVAGIDNILSEFYSTCLNEIILVCTLISV